MQGKFTEKAQEVIRKAQEAAYDLGHDYIGTEHLLIGIMSVSDSVAAKAIAIIMVWCCDAIARSVYFAI